MDNNLAGQPLGSGIAERAKAILMRPKTEWPRIAEETTQPPQLLKSYAAPLAAIGPVATLIGGQLFGYGVLGIVYRPGLVSALVGAVVSFILALVSLFIVAWIANFLSPKFGGRQDWPAAFRLTAYSMTAAWLAGIFGLVPALGILGILALYSFYLFYLGAKPLLGVPDDKSAAYTAVTVAIAIVLYLVVGSIAAATMGSMAMASGVAATDDGRATIDLGQYGSVKVDGENGTIDLGEMGRIEVDGDTAKVTANGETVQVRTDQEQ